jgi:hypothetical protein
MVTAKEDNRTSRRPNTYEYELGIGLELSQFQSMSGPVFLFNLVGNSYNVFKV